MVNEKPADSNERLNVAYTRVSTSRQEDDGYGKPVQMRAVQAWADLGGIKIDRWFHDSETGKTDDRADFQKIKRLIADGKVARVLIARQDRLARSSLVAEQFYQELRASGGELVNVQVLIDDSPFGKVIRKMLDSFAELDRDLIVERTSRGAREKVSTTGLHHGGVCPTGYRAPTEAEREQLGLPKGSLVIDSPCDEAVRVSFALREKGHSYGNIARWLNKRGFVGKKGARFSAALINNVIANEPFYRGECVAMSREKLGISEENYDALIPKHPPILPPRPDGQADLTHRVTRTPVRFAAIPEDPYSDEPLRARPVNTITTVTREYGAALIAMQQLLDEGLTYDAVSDALNEAGHRTRMGCVYRMSAVHRIEKMLYRLLPLAREAVSRPQTSKSEVPKSTNEGATLDLAQTLARTRGKDGKRLFSYAQIADRLNEKYSTSRGCAFHAMTVKRMLEASPTSEVSVRTAAYIRLTKEGLDHHGQDDQLEGWAEDNQIEIYERYIDRGPANKTNQLPEMRRLLADVEQGKIHRVAVVNRELLCRDPDESEGIMTRLQRHADLFLVGQNHKTVSKRPPYVPQGLAKAS